MEAFDLRDDQWERIRDLLPGRDGHVGVTARNNRLFVEAVVYRYRAGVAWRDLPERFGDWKNIHRRFSRWAKTGVWDRAFDALTEDDTNAIADSTFARACQHRAAAQQQAYATMLAAE